jgi:hypothetical protein
MRSSSLAVHLANVEAEELFRLLSDRLHRGDLRSSRAFAAEADRRLHGFRRSLEDGLHPTVGPVAHPTGDITGLGHPGDGQPEADALDAAVNGHSSPYHERPGYGKVQRP